MKKPNQNLYVVGIGASAGGLKAIQKLFDHIPEDTGMAFVIIQHLSPDYKSLMQELLSKHTQMKVLPAENELTIEPNCIYLNQRNKNLTIEGKRLRLIDRDRQNDLHLPIDMFFHSLGQEFKEKSIGIILSGTGSDGSRGIRTIKEAGGTIIAEDPTSAQFDGMPNSSIATNLVDYILPPNKIPEVILRLSNQRVQLTSSQQFASTDDVNFYRILNEIHKSSGIDFRKYKRNTLLRRLEKRMTMNNIDQLYDYLTFLQNMPSEKQTLQQDFLIGVTSFFRDREAFNSLKETLPIIFNGKNPSDVVRIWVAGCSTGEEVYSIAILVDEYIHKNKLLIDFKIFATDIDQKALDLASVGQYHINSISELEEKHLEKYFTVHENGIQIKNRIREKIVFSKHNLLKDPPFIRMDMITCRNLLIYLETNIQSKVLMSFQFALKKSGVLFLGNSESLGKMSKYFHPLDPKWNIFKNISDTKLINFETNPESRVRTLTYNSPITQSNKPNYRIQEKPENIFYKFLSDVYSPDCIIFDKDYNVLFISGNAGQRIAVQAGIFQNNLLKMVEKEIASIIRSGIRRVTTESKQVVITDVINSKGNQTYSFDLTFRRIDDNAALQDLYLMEFSQERKTNQEIVEIPNIPLDEISKQRINDLENELREKKIELQNLIEELETSNEELQSSNEELMASNEELQVMSIIFCKINQAIPTIS